jgi:endonuclease/exonuclease/phosphatase family metal-dependent hydrolase
MVGPPSPRPPTAWWRVLALALACLGSPTATPAVESPPAGQAESPAEIRVVAYNLRNWLRMERRLSGDPVPDAPKPEAEKAAVVRILAHVRPDVLGVCEIGTAEDVADLQARLRDAGHHLPHLLLHQGADPERRLALISRFPIVANQSATDLTYSIGSRSHRFQRGILDATLQITPDYRLRLLGTHLKSRREVEEGDQAVMRRHEAVLLREHVEKILEATPDTNLLLYGDFNDTKNQQPIKVIQGRFGDANHLRDLWLKDEDGHRFTYYWSVADSYDRIDFAFVNEGLWPEIETAKSFLAADPDWLKASDHRPLVIVLRPEESPGRRRSP